MASDSLPLGIVIERRQSDHPWQDTVWQAVAVLPGAPAVAGWVELDRGDDWTRFHAGTLELQIFSGETEGYKTNLSGDRVVYVVLREDEEGDDMELFLATVCPYEAQDYMDSGEEIIERVPMPPDLAAWLKDFVDRHHVDEPFQKRKNKSGKRREQPPGQQQAGHDR